MKRLNFPFLLLASFAALLLCGCKSKQSTPEDAQIKDNVYTNRFFGFQVQLPGTWKILNKPSKRDIRKGSEAVLGGDKELAKAAANADVAPLLMAIDLSSGRTLAIAAENLSGVGEIRTGADYLEAMLSVLTGTGKPLQGVNAISPVQLHTKKFHRVDLAGQVSGTQQYQGVFAVVEKGYALTIMVGAKSSDEVDDVLAKVGLFRGQDTRALATATKSGSDAAWLNDIKLQGIGGTEGRRFAIINGRTLETGEAGKVKTSKTNVLVRCVAISNASVVVMIEGLRGERKLHLN